MNIDLTKLSTLEKQFKNSIPHMSEAGAPQLTYSETFAFVMEVLKKYYDTPTDDVDTLEAYFPVYQDLQKLGVVSDAPEMEEIPDEEEDEEEDPNDEEDDG